MNKGTIKSVSCILCGVLTSSTRKGALCTTCFDTNRLQARTKYYQKNKERIKQYNKRYMYHRLKTDPGYRLMFNFRSRLSQVLKGTYVSKSLPFNSNEIRSHLQSLWKEGMNWTNYGYGPGKWVVDHIKPVCIFDMTKKEDRLNCWSLSNLQPLWYEENISKSNKV